MSIRIVQWRIKLLEFEFIEPCAGAGGDGDVVQIKNMGDAFSELLLLYDYSVQHALLPHAENIKAVIQLWNPGWQNPVFEYSPTEKRLLIGGDGLAQLRTSSRWSFSECILRTLRLRHLVFDDTDFSDLSQLRQLQIGSLDISRTQVENLEGLARMPTLIELTVREGQFTQKQLNSIHPGIKVVTIP